MGITLLGLVIGAVTGVFATSAIARPMVETGGEDISTGGALLLGSLTPGLAVIGAVVAVLIYFKADAGE